MSLPRPGNPERLGKYRVLGRLGDGAQGVVFLAEAPDGTRVAIKLLHPQLVGDADARSGTCVRSRRPSGSRGPAPPRSSTPTRSASGPTSSANTPPARHCTSPYASCSSLGVTSRWAPPAHATPSAGRPVLRRNQAGLPGPADARSSLEMTVFAASIVGAALG
jgi:hypothetical protein